MWIYIFKKEKTILGAVSAVGNFKPYSLTQLFCKDVVPDQQNQ